MGFWHTGYMDHHETTGLDDCRAVLMEPIVYPCKRCGENFQLPDDLRTHCFEKHPAQKPVLYVHGKELGNKPYRVTQHIAQSDIIVTNCDHVFFNDKEMTIDAICRELSRLSWDTCRIKLQKEDVVVEFALNFCIASPEDIRGIEEQFEEMVAKHRLDTCVIDEFIAATKKYKTAIGYCDGICAYLYGIMAKERMPGSLTDHPQYVGKYNKAVEQMAGYERPLAKVVSGLIGFHFNHFAETVCLVSNKTRAGQTAIRYQEWIQENMTESWSVHGSDASLMRTESLLVDRNTKKITHWMTQPLENLFGKEDKIESFLKDNLEQYDAVKVQMLLCKMYQMANNVNNGASRHAKSLRNQIGPIGKWAEAQIGKDFQFANGKV